GVLADADLRARPDDLTGGVRAVGSEAPPPHPEGGIAVRRGPEERDRRRGARERRDPREARGRPGAHPRRRRGLGCRRGPLVDPGPPPGPLTAQREAPRTPSRRPGRFVVLDANLVGAGGRPGVEPAGLEPATFSMPSRRATDCATAPWHPARARTSTAGRAPL